MRNNQKFIPIIGLEIHVELKTKSKMFCGCRNDPFHAPKPNIYTCPVCLGLPGALPVPNKKAIEWTLMLGLELDCKVNLESKFDRKHYFYPDLPKGYQISQYDKPLCFSGRITLDSTDFDIPAAAEPFEVGVTRIHLEEDTAKMQHQVLMRDKLSLIDFNRSGVPLVEIVTEPFESNTFREAAQKSYWLAKKIFRTVMDLQISDADMEKGSMRLEANISLKETKEKDLPKYKVELKNINSFRFLEDAILHELNRQKELLESKEKVEQETRGWDSSTKSSKSQRTKETAADYRYFPEPDIPPLVFAEEEINKLKVDAEKLMKEGSQKKKMLFMSEYGISQQIAGSLTQESKTSFLSEASISHYRTIKGEPGTVDYANWLNQHKNELIESNDPKAIVHQYIEVKSSVVADQNILERWINEVIHENPSAVVQFKAGESKVLGFLIGQAQKKAKGKANAGKLREILIGKLK